MRRFAAIEGLGPVVIGPGGLALLALSCLLIVLSCAASFLATLAWIGSRGWRARSVVTAIGRVLVLGMELDARGHPLPAYQARLERALALWRSAPDTEIVLLGGRTVPRQRSEAQAGSLYLQARGVPGGSIRCEDRSRHTLENLLLYRAQFAPDSGPPDWGPPALVTNRFHLARASLTAAHLGIAHVTCAAEDRRSAMLRDIPRLLSEGFFVHWYLTSRAYVRLTGHRRLAARIS